MASTNKSTGYWGFDDNRWYDPRVPLVLGTDSTEPRTVGGGIGPFFLLVTRGPAGTIRRWTLQVIRYDGLAFEAYARSLRELVRYMRLNPSNFDWRGFLLCRPRASWRRSGFD